MVGSHGLWHQGKEGTVEIAALTILLMFFTGALVVLLWGLNNLFNDVYRHHKETKRLLKELKEKIELKNEEY